MMTYENEIQRRGESIEALCKQDVLFLSTNAFDMLVSNKFCGNCDKKKEKKPQAAGGKQLISFQNLEDGYGMLWRQIVTNAHKVET